MLLKYKIHESCSSVEYDMIIESSFFIFYLKLEIWLKEDVTEVHELQVSTLTPFSFIMPYVSMLRTFLCSVIRAAQHFYDFVMFFVWRDSLDLHCLLWLSLLHSMIATNEFKIMLYKLYDWCCCTWFFECVA